MEKQDFQNELERIEGIAREALDIVRMFPSPEAVTMSAKVMLLDKSERILHEVKMLMMRAEVTVAMSQSNAINHPWMPPRINISQSLINFDKHR